MMEIELNEKKLTGARKFFAVVAILLVLAVVLPSLLLWLTALTVVLALPAVAYRAIMGRWPLWFQVITE